MECKQDQNKENCTCSYNPCKQKHICCECLKFHFNIRQLPACCFPPEVERTYDRSFEKFAKLVHEGKI